MSSKIQDVRFFTQVKLSGHRLRAYVEFEVIVDGATKVKLQLPPQQLDQLANQFQRAATNAVAQEAFWEMMKNFNFGEQESIRLLIAFREFYDRAETRMDVETAQTISEWNTERGDPHDDDEEKEDKD